MSDAQKEVSSSQMLARVMKELIDRREWSFSIREKELLSSEVSDENGFLPLLIEKAQMRAESVFGEQWNNKMSYHYVPTALCQMVPDEQSLRSMPVSILLLFADQALEELIREQYWASAPSRRRRPDEPIPKGAKLTASLDHWMDEFVERYEKRLIQLQVPKTTPSPAPRSGTQGL